MDEGRKWYLIFYDVKGSKAFAKSTFRSKISRELAKTPMVPLQQSVWAVLQTPQNKAIVDRLVEVIRAQNAKVLLFEGSPALPTTNSDVEEMIGGLIDRKYEILQKQLQSLKALVKKSEDRAKRKKEFSRAALRLRRKFDRVSGLDPREMISNARSLIEGEFFALEKEINEMP
ncbi:MAG: Chromate resistance protein ChrB [Candidatus Micrarchaeota archaeon]